nr:hypothetical protein [Tanacetum cinerariifolium]
MALLTFADTHNMITFLTKSDASKGFNQIVDFMNAHTIQYALMVNPTIYVSCIKQIWASVLIKKSNDVIKLQALIDRKKCMSAKRTAWNEFSSFMASDVIFLATVIGFVLELALTVLDTFLASLKTLSGQILNIPGAITLALFTPLETGGVETELEVTGFDKAFVSPILGRISAIGCFANLVFLLES